MAQKLIITLIFKNKKLNKIIAEYTGNDNSEKAIAYINQFADCSDGSLYGAHMCFKKGATKNDINTLLGAYILTRNDETGELL